MVMRISHSQSGKSIIKRETQTWLKMMIDPTVLAFMDVPEGDIVSPNSPQAKDAAEDKSGGDLYVPLGVRL
jgi:hypothetical protein